MAISAYKTTKKAKDEQLRKIFEALSDPNRFKMFKILLRKKDICVSELADKLNFSVPAASQHLKILELHGLVERERMGHMICYRVKADHPAVQSIITLI